MDDIAEAIVTMTNVEVDPARFINRELSWLEFNERVLAIAASSATPPLERVKFLAIFSQNLDEFFQVRVAGLLDQVDGGVTDLSPDGRSASQQLALITRQVAGLTRRADRIFLNEIIPALAIHDIRFCSWSDLDQADQHFLSDQFDRRIFPVLTPLAVDPAHPFPYISNMSLNLAITVRDPDDGEHRFARLKVPPLLPRFIAMADGERFISIEQVISAHLGRLFHGMIVDECEPFRVTRNADLDLEEEEADDLLEAVEMEVRRRRFGNPVRLEVPSTMSAEMVELLRHELDVEDAVYRHDSPLDLGGLWSVYSLERPDLKYPLHTPVNARALTSGDDKAADFFRVLKRGDVLLHHPYESFATSVEEFIRQGSVDPNVLAIKMTLYRTSGDSAIVESLIRAAEAGKQVVVLVELKARFDEANNIEWARHLERSGVHVVYGLVGLKTHTKIVMIAREEDDAVRVYCHVGTGNYNSKTARTYEDFGILTASEDVATDAQNLFNFLTGYSRDVSYSRLLVAPRDLRSELIDLIRSERAHHLAANCPSSGHIIMKMNSLSDPEIIDELYEASADGVEIDLIVRGICCLRPQVPGLSDNIRVRSLVGRYLEHSRIYRFANGAGPAQPKLFLGSADLMGRNLNRRVEALISVVHPMLIDRIDATLATLLDDEALSWTLQDSVWHRNADRYLRRGDSLIDAHMVLHEMAHTWNSQGRTPDPLTWPTR